MLAPDEASQKDGGFKLTLANFEGPLDLLLSLISRRKLDITEVALAQVTDEFIAYMRTDTSLAALSEFVVIAAVLLDMKAAHLLPGDEETQDDLEILEARDLLFARLLQYRAFKEVAAILRERRELEGKFHAHTGVAEQRLIDTRRPLRLSATPEDLALLAARAFIHAAPHVELAHLHHPSVSVASQVNYIRDQLQTSRILSFRSLVVDAPDRATIVARFLAILEMHKAGFVSLMQAEPMGDVQISVRSVDAADTAVEEASEFDEPVAVSSSSLDEAAALSDDNEYSSKDRQRGRVGD